MPSTIADLVRELTPTPLGSEATRDFYQARISLFCGVMAAISAIFFVAHAAMELLSGHLPLDQLFALPLNRWHLAALALATLGCWVTRVRAYSLATLTWLDAGATLAVPFALHMMGSTLLGAEAPHFDLVLTLIYVLFHLTRAVIVPSTARRTLLLCAISAIPLLFITWQLALHAPDGWSTARVLYAPLYVALWCLVSALPAALGSSVIYGLRREVRSAQRLGQYTLEEQIGSGGMGTVYRARHALLRRPTAVKLLKPERNSEQALLRFEREVQLTSLLTHPNTVSIYDYGRTSDGIFYYAMEYLDGLDLQHLVELDGPQEPARVVHIMKQVCGALAEAHAAGLVHRDVKPANIILCERGGAADFAKVVDFGLVKSLLAAEPTHGQPDLALSAAHAIIGTPYFLAPEAVRTPERVDARCDLYALGAVGYYLLTGSPVFEGASALEILGHHLHTPPVPPSVRMTVGLPGELEAVLLRCLEKQASARPESALELARLLETCGVEPWTDKRARALWTLTHARRARANPVDHRTAVSPTLLAIDLERTGGVARP